MKPGSFKGKDYFVRKTEAEVVSESMQDGNLFTPFLEHRDSDAKKTEKNKQSSDPGCCDNVLLSIPCVVM